MNFDLTTIIYLVISILVFFFGAKWSIPRIFRKVSEWAIKVQPVFAEFDDVSTELGNRLADGDASMEDVTVIFKESKDIYDFFKNLKNASKKK